MTLEGKVDRVDVMALERRPPVVVEEVATVREVIAKLRHEGQSCALVATRGKLVGIFSERDVVREVLGRDEALDRPVSALMTPDPTGVTEDESIRQVVSLMHQGGFRNVPIVDGENRVVGCVRHKDIIRYLVNNYADRVLNLPPDPDLVATTPEGG